MTSDKSYAVEARLNNYISAMQGLSAVGYQSAYLNANAPQCSSTSQVSTGLAVQINQTGVSYGWEIACYVSAQSTNSIYITLAGPTTSAFDALIKWESLFATPVDSALNWTVRQTTIGVNTNLGLGTATGHNVINGGGYWVWIQGHATFTATGTLTVNQASSANVASFTVQQGSQLRVYAG